MSERGERVPSPRAHMGGGCATNMLVVSTAWLRLNSFSKMLVRVGLRPVGLTELAELVHEIVST